MHHGNVELAGKLRDAADVAGGDDVRLHAPDVLRLAIAQCAGELRLEDVVGSGRAAANVRFRNVDHRVARLDEQLARLVLDALAVLQRARRMIGDAQRRPALGGPELVLADEFGDVVRQVRDAGGPRGIVGLALQKVAIVLHHRSAARGVDDDGVDRTLGQHLRPGVDVALGEVGRTRLVAKVIGERAAAAGTGRDDNVDAAPGEEADGRIVDARAQHLLRAAGEHDDARAAVFLGGGGAGPLEFRRGRQHGGRQLDHGGDLVEAETAQRVEPRTAERRELQRQPEALRIGQHARQELAHEAFSKRARRRLLDVAARQIDQMHVVDTARTGRHAGQA